MSGVTKEQIAKAKEWDLLSYLQIYEPQEVKKCGGSEYRTAMHDSLKISNGKWHWHSRGIGGKTALDYLIKVRGMEFVEAVGLLCGEGRAADCGMASARRNEEGVKNRKEKLFRLPEKNRYGTAMVSYLQGRGIDAEVISRCIGAGILYESRPYHNCVFVGRDPEGEARYAFLRGTGGSFRMDVEGSDKRYGFCLQAGDKGSRSVAVAESPIDALSQATLLKMQGDDWTGNHYLSLGGTAPRALVQFLCDHPGVDRVSLCLDNDRAGKLGMGRIRDALLADAGISGRITEIRENPPPESYGKDYNELLKKKTPRCGEKNLRGGKRTGGQESHR